MTHRCHVKGCTVQVAEEFLMCLAHWQRVPKVLRDSVWAEYRPGQERDKRPSRRYLDAAQAAINAAAEAST